MTCLMMGYGLLLLRSYDLVLALQTSDNPVHGIEEVLSVDFRLVASCSGKGCLIADIGNVRSRKSRGVFCKECDIEILGELQSPQVYIEYLFPLLQVREVHMYLPVETPCTEQSLVEDIRPVGRSQDDDPRIGVESVHFRKKLVESIFALVI